VASDHAAFHAACAVLAWTQSGRDCWSFVAPGKPTDNAYIESFNGKLRAECLNANWFLSLDEARQKCEAWRTHHNDVRSDSPLVGKTPRELHPRLGNPDQPSRG
jgi:putative transposase